MIYAVQASLAIRLGTLLASTAFASCLLILPAQAQVPTPNANQYGLGLIGAPTAWGLGYTGAGITVAVADTGIDTAHPAFAGKIDPRSTNFVLTTANAPFVASQIQDSDPGGHGTHVAGIIAAAGNSQSPGVAYNANLVVLRAIPGTRVAVVADQFQPGGATVLDYFAGLQNVMVYNASYGPDPGRNNRIWAANTIDAAEAASVQNAIARGKIIVAATGNDRQTNPIAATQPSGISLYPFIRPANANAGVYQDGGNNFDFSGLTQQSGQVIAVTSVGQDKTVAAYANYCGVTASWCVAAPGGDQAKDNGIYSTLPGGNYGFLQGTSMAAPMVSGALAVLQQAYPAYTAQELARVLFATAENVGGQAGDNAIYGYGMIRLDRAVAGPTTLPVPTINVATQQMTYWSQPLTTGGAFTKTGDGYLNIAGRTTATGDVTVSAGALAVDGTLNLGTRLTIAQGATLAGFGAVNGNVFINGTLSAGQLPNYGDLIANNGGSMPAGVPLTGTSPGTLTFQGNLTLGAGATTRVNVDGTLANPGGPGTWDKIIISGNGSSFSANGVLSPILRGIVGGNNNYTPAVGTQFQFVIAQNGATVTGGFSGLTQPVAGLAANTRFDVVYAPTTITLSVTPLTFAGLAATRAMNANEIAVAQAIDNQRPAAGLAPRASLAPLFNLLDLESADGDAEAFDALSGQGQAAMPRAIMDAFYGLSDIVADRQAAAGSGSGDVHAALTPNVAFAYASARPSTEARAAGLPAMIAQPASLPGQWTTWGQVYGRNSNVGDRNGLTGYNSTGGGFVLGTDRMVSANFLAGAAIGYAHARTASEDTTGNTDVYSGQLYATYTPGAFVLSGRLVGGVTTTGTTRSIDFPGLATKASGSVDGWGALAAGEVGYRLKAAGITFMPYVGLMAQTLERSAFTESTPFGLSFPAQTFTRVATDVGMSASSSFQARGFTFMPTVKLAWAHDLRDDTLAIQTALFDAPFVINAADPGRDAAVVGLKLAAWQTEKLRVFAAYTGEFRSNAAAHQLSGGLRVSW